MCENPPELDKMNVYIDRILDYLQQIQSDEFDQNDINEVYEYIINTPLPQIFTCKILQKQYSKKIANRKRKLMFAFRNVLKFIVSDDEKLDSFFTIAPIFPLLLLTFDIPNLLNDFVRSYFETLGSIPEEEDLDEIDESLPLKTNPRDKKAKQIKFGEMQHLSPCEIRRKKFKEDRNSIKQDRQEIRQSNLIDKPPGWDMNCEGAHCFDD